MYIFILENINRFLLMNLLSIIMFLLYNSAALAASEVNTLYYYLIYRYTCN